MNFICTPCKEGSDRFGKRNILANAMMHNDCRGGTWCDCQHKILRKATAK